VPTQVLDRVAVETRGVERDQRHVGLARGRGREQVTDIDAALEHDHVVPLGEPGEGTRLPGGTGRQHQDDDHVSSPRR